MDPSQATPEEAAAYAARDGFVIGFSEDRNKRCRKTMEDSHAFLHSYGGVSGQGFFAVYDGHAGKAAADWCGSNVHATLERLVRENPDADVPELLDRTFVQTDEQLADRKGLHSGCTAIVAYIRMESSEEGTTLAASEGGAVAGEERPRRMQRILYTANVGDARAVLCRDGRAVRLSYDHKGSDPAEQQRIADAGGFVVNNRVNGILAVTRSLGDTSMKDLIIGNPYTTQTVLTEKDEFLILACDGVWDVCTDSEAVELVKEVQDVQKASERLLQYSLDNHSTDNLSAIVVRFDPAWKPAEVSAVEA
ncbi:phosphatase 2C-like domain-containing protein [Hyaloraphidium curvatum]|nr:phosphatase 2C-like domain-containing protein [Hyaloraphidium curvatum]